MNSLLQTLLEDITSNQPNVYSATRNINTAKINLANYMRERIASYDKLSKAISAQMLSVAPNGKEVRIPEDFPYYALNNIRVPINFQSIVRSAWNISDPDAIDKYIVKELSTQLVGKELTSFDELYNNIIGETVGDEKLVDASTLSQKISYLQNSIIDRIETLNLVFDEIMSIDAQSEETLQNGAIIFSDFCKFIATMGKVNIYIYNKIYNVCKKSIQGPTPSESKLSNAQVTYDAILKSTQDVKSAQDKWTEKYKSPNSEFAKRMDVLTEKLDDAKKDIENSEKEVESDKDDKAEDIAEDVVEIAEKLFNLHKEFEYNELVKYAVDSEYAPTEGKSSDDIEKTATEKIKSILDDGGPVEFQLFEVPELTESKYEELDKNFIPKVKEIVEDDDKFNLVVDKRSTSMNVFMVLKTDMLDSEKEEDDDKEVDDSITEATLTSEERNDLSDSSFGLPKRRAYPLIDENHIKQAITMFRYAENNEKKTLAKNIKNKIIELRLVGKIRIGKNNTYKKYFPKWMWEDSVSTAEYDGNSYKILMNMKVVEHGTIKKDAPINESVYNTIFNNVGDTYL